MLVDISDIKKDLNEEESEILLALDTLLTLIQIKKNIIYLKQKSISRD